MQVLNEQEAIEFKAKHGLQNRFNDLPVEAIRTEYTKDVGQRAFIAKVFTELLVNEPDSIVCLDITDWNVGPSAQELSLFYSYRQSLGETRLLIDAHFHVFTAQEANEFRNILHLALISLFDVAGASTTTDFRFYASHDEWIDIPWHDGAPWRENLEGWFGTKA